MRTSVMLKLGIMAVLFVVLLLPVTLILGLVSERTARRDEAAQGISAEWGGAQQVAGPILSIPFRYTVERSETQREEIEDRASFLPELVEVRATLSPELRRRGPFDVAVYRARLEITGRFRRPDVAAVFRGAHQINWTGAMLTLGLSDPRGIAGPVALTWNGASLPVRPGVAEPLIGKGLSVALPAATADGPETIPFAITLDLNGTRDLSFLSLGNDTNVSLQSSWPHPGFRGAPLPLQHSITGEGFSASWQVPYFGRNVPTAWRARDLDRDRLTQSLQDAAFGVTLVQPVDIYQQTERAVKYAALFLVLTFVIAFIWEIIGGVAVHPVQYVFIGFALCLFYLLLLAISEHTGFDIAYSTAAVSTVLLITWYWQWVINARAKALLMLAALGSLYGYLYLLLRLESYSLLAGAVGLFAMLALVMFLTRRVDWYSLRVGPIDKAWW